MKFQVDDRVHDRLAELAQQLQDIAKGGMEAFTALLTALEDIIPMLLHVQYAHLASIDHISCLLSGAMDVKRV
jgi:hypothetical protein